MVEETSSGGGGGEVGTIEQGGGGVGFSFRLGFLDGGGLECYVWVRVNGGGGAGGFIEQRRGPPVAG